MPRPLKSEFAARQRAIVLTVTCVGDRPTGYRVAWKSAEKGDTKEQDWTLLEGSWDVSMSTKEQGIRALVRLARVLYDTHLAEPE